MDGASESDDSSSSTTSDDSEAWRQSTRLIYDQISILSTMGCLMSCEFLKDEQRMMLFCGTSYFNGRGELFLNEIETVSLSPTQVLSQNVMGRTYKAFSSSTLYKYDHSGGEVNRLRCNPGDDLLATFSSNAKLYIYDLKGIKDRGDVNLSPVTQLEYHTDHGYTISWNPEIRGRLATGSWDTKVAVWDVEVSQGPTTVLQGHTGAIGEVIWHASNPNVLLTVCDDNFFRIWDIRESVINPSMAMEGFKDGEINCLSQNRYYDFLVAIGGTDPDIKLVDIRAAASVLHLVETEHQSGILNVQFHPVRKSMIFSGGDDRKIAIYDLNLIGNDTFADEIYDDDHEFEELIFTHSGHSSMLHDFAIYEDPENVIVASCAGEEEVHIWQVRNDLIDHSTDISLNVNWDDS
ncbi:hypothetical protein ACOME3_000034 [Neoechinorhynchus agilis]